MATSRVNTSTSIDIQKQRTPNWIPVNSLIAIRFILGWQFISAAFRRYLNDPSKLDYYAKSNIGHKFSTMVPHSIWPLNYLMSDLILRPHMAFDFLIVFTWIEFTVGLFLITGTLTRLSALGAVLLSFGILWGDGWQGVTCVDEWQIGTVEGIGAMIFMFAGSGRWSIDAWLHKYWDGYVRIGKIKLHLA